MKSWDQVGELLLITYLPFFFIPQVEKVKWGEARWGGGFLQLLINMLNFLKVKWVKWGRLGGFPSITYPHSEKKFKLEGWGEGGRLGLPLFSHTHIRHFFLNLEGWGKARRLGGLLSITYPHNEFFISCGGDISMGCL